MNISWLIELGATAPVIIVFVMGVMFAGYVMLRERAQKKLNDILFTESKELRHKYSQLDKIVFGMGIALQVKHNKEMELIKQSADGNGDYVMNRDIK